MAALCLSHFDNAKVQLFHYSTKLSACKVHVFTTLFCTLCLHRFSVNSVFSFIMSGVFTNQNFSIYIYKY